MRPVLRALSVAAQFLRLALKLPGVFIGGWVRYCGYRRAFVQEAAAYGLPKEAARELAKMRSPHALMRQMEIGSFIQRASKRK